MKFDEVVKRFSSQPILDSEMLLVNGQNPNAVWVQLDRWVKAGKLIQLRRGLYILNGPYRKVSIEIPYLASFLYKPSYISLEYALSYYGLIPEGVPNVTSVTTRRTAEFSNSLGVFIYRHIKKELFWGYHPITMAGQIAFHAFPEKALLDTLYFESRRVNRLFLEGLRLQNVDVIDLKQLNKFAGRFKSPRIRKAVEVAKDYIKELKKPL